VKLAMTWRRAGRALSYCCQKDGTDTCPELAFEFENLKSAASGSFAAISIANLRAPPICGGFWARRRTRPLHHRCGCVALACVSLLRTFNGYVSSTSMSDSAVPTRASNRCGQAVNHNHCPGSRDPFCPRRCRGNSAQQMGSGSLIVIKRDGRDGQRYVLDSRNWCAIGSHAECDIIIRSHGVAELHALFMFRKEDGAQVFGLDESLPTVCPAKKASLLKDEGAKLDNGDVFVVGERKFRFEEIRHPGTVASEALSDSTNIPSSPRVTLDGKRFAPQVIRSASVNGGERRNSLLVKDEVEEFRQAATTQVFMTARRMSLPASEVADEFFASTRSPRKRKSLAHFGETRHSPVAKCAQRQIPFTSPARPRSTRRSAQPLSTGKPVGSHATPQSRLQTSQPLRSLAVAFGDGDDKVAEITAALNLQSRMTPRRAKPSGLNISRQEIDRRMTPRRAGARPSAARTPSKLLNEAEYAHRITPRRAVPCPIAEATPTPYAAAVEAAADRMTPRRAKRRSSSLIREDREIDVINSRVAAESPLFTRPPKRARTCSKKPRTVLTYRDTLAFTTPRRSKTAPPRFVETPRKKIVGAEQTNLVVKTEVDEQAELAAEPSTKVTPSRIFSPELVVKAITPTKEEVDTIARDELVTLGNEAGSRVERGTQRLASPRILHAELMEDVTTPTKKVDVNAIAGLELVMLGSNDSLEEIVLTGKKNTPGQALSDRESEINDVEPASRVVRVDNVGEAVCTSPKLSSSAQSLRAKSSNTLSRTLRIPPPETPMVTPEKIEAAAGMLSVPRKQTPAVGIQRLELRSDMDEEAESADKLFAGVTPAARILPRSQSAMWRTAATDSRIPRKSQLPHTPEKQIRPASAMKQCLSQKPRSAISKSSRKGCRKSGNIRKTVLFADSVGEDIELASGPHYSPPLKPRGSPRICRTLEETDSSDDCPASSPVRPASASPFVPLPRPSPGTNESDPLKAAVHTTALGEMTHALGLPPSTPLGRLGMFFYPTRPTVPLLTYRNSAEPSYAAEVEQAQQSSSSLEISSSSEGIPVSLPFTEGKSETPVNIPSRRRSILGDIADLGSYAAGSVLRRLSGTATSEPVEVESHSQAAISAVDGPVTSETELHAGDTIVPPEEKDNQLMDVDHGTMAREVVDREGNNEVSEPSVPLQSDNDVLMELDISNDCDGNQLPTTPRRQSLLGRAFNAVFGSRAKKRTAKVPEAQEGDTSAIPEVVPAICDLPRASPIPVDVPSSGGYLEDNTNAETMEEHEVTFANWTVKELREYLTGLGYTLHGERKAKLIEMAVGVSRKSESTEAPLAGMDIGLASPEVEESQCLPQERQNDLRAKTVFDLRALLAGLGLDTSGKKAQLVARLEQSVSDAAAMECSGALQPHPSVKSSQEQSEGESDTADDESPAYSTMTVKQLRALLDERRLESTGRKDTLVQRLSEHDASEAAATSTENSKAPEDAVDVSDAQEVNAVGNQDGPADAEDVIDESTQYSAKTVKQLRALLEERHLESGGRKDALIQRLKEHDALETAAEPIVHSIAPTGAVDVGDVESMTVTQLRYSLSAMDLDATGRKAELRDRLMLALSGGTQSVETTTNEEAEEDKEWKSKDASKMTVAELRAVLLDSAMCGAGNKTRLQQKMKVLQDGTRVTRHRRGQDEILTCAACDAGATCEASS
jgi:SAP domain